MLKDINRCLRLLTRKERAILYFYAFSRSALGILDVFGILLVGVLVGKIGSQTTVSRQSTSSNMTLSFFPNLEISITSLAALILITFLMKSGLSILFTRLMTLHLFRIEAALSKHGYRKLLLSKSSDIDGWSRSEIGFALTYGAGFATTTTLAFAIIAVSETLLLLGITLAFAAVNPVMTLGMVVYFAILGILIQKFVGSKFKEAGSSFASSAMKSDTLVQDSLSAFREIKTLGKNDFFVNKFSGERNMLAKSTATISYLGTLPRYIIESALMVGVALIAFASVRNGDIQTAAVTLGVFITGGLRIMASMLPLQGALGALKQQISQSKIFFELNDSLVSSNASPADNPQLQGGFENESPSNVSLSNLYFTYPNTYAPAISGVSLEIEPGQMAAVIGPSGSGKSTLADLILGLATPDSGQVLIGSKAISGASQAPRVGYVPQSPGIITGTIAENVALGVLDDEVNLEKLDHAIAIANLTSTIQALPLGTKTHLGPQSNALSGGQLQRIGLARALYFSPSLLVLDEATSALDADSESAITNALSKIGKTTTIVVIAHRMSTVQNADIIFVLEHGKIIASGTFRELMASSDLVSRYVELSAIKPIN